MASPLLLVDRTGHLRANVFGQVDDLSLGATLARLIDEPAASVKETAA